MDADEHVLAVGDVAADQRDVLLVVELVLEHVNREIAVIASAASPTATRLTSDSVRIRYLMRSAIVIISRPCFFANFVSSRHARHRAVFVHDFADDAGRIQPGDAREVDGRFGLTRAHHHAAGARAQRKHVAGPRQIGRAASPDRSRARTVAARSPAEMPVVVRPFASIGTQNAVSKRDGVLRDHQRDLELVEPLRRHRQADQAAAVSRHEVDRLGRDLLGGDRQIALVLAILVVDDDDHPAGADRVDRVLDPGERTGASAAPLAISMRALGLRSRRSMCHLAGRDGRERQTRQLRGAHDVLADHVALEVDAVADLRPPQVRVLQRERHDLHVEPVRAEPGNRQADAVDGDRALVDDVRRELRRES